MSITFINGIETRNNINTKLKEEIHSTYNKELELRLNIETFLSNANDGNTMKIMQPSNNHISLELKDYINDKKIEFIHQDLNLDITGTLGTFNKILILKYLKDTVQTEFMSWVDVDVVFTQKIKNPFKNKFYVSAIPFSKMSGMSGMSGMEESFRIDKLYTKYFKETFKYKTPSIFIPSCIILGPTDSPIWDKFLNLAMELFNFAISTNQYFLIPHCEEIALSIIYCNNQSSFILDDKIAYQEINSSLTIPGNDNTLFYHYHHFNLFLNNFKQYPKWLYPIFRTIIKTMGLKQTMTEFNLDLKTLKTLKDI